MCACRLEMQPTSTNRTNLYGDLEEYLTEMEERSGFNGSSGESEDVYVQLAQKENDLILAAELGKALLERNDELSRANERLSEEYSHKLEFLEQEKHALRRKLDTLEAEYDTRVAELQSDISQLRKELLTQQSLLRSSEQDKGKVLQELTEQNHRLTEQLKSASRSEEQLQAQLKSLREQFNVRRSNLHDHVSQLEGLREEINLLTERKADLERRIHFVSEERESLSLSLDESGERILMLERSNKEQDQQLKNQLREIEELRQANNQLQDKLDNVLRRSNSPSFGQHSLYNEIEMSSQSSTDDELRSLNGSQSGRSRSHPGSSMGFHGDEDIECDDSELILSGMDESEQNWKFRQELAAVYQQLWQICKELRQRKDSLSADSGISASPEEIQAHQIRIGMLSAILKDLKILIEETLLNSSDSNCLTCQSLEDERNTITSLKKELQEKSEELKRKTEELSELTTKLSVQETELAAIREERDQLRHDVDNSTMAKDDIIKKAWEMRDQAVARKNAVEIELAKARIDLMHINSQLMEAIQQKVELSQQLEQWQVDMQILLDEQVLKQLQNQEEKEKSKRKVAHKRTNSKSKLFGFWR